MRSAPLPECAGLYIVRARDGHTFLYIGEASSVSERHECHGGTRAYFSAFAPGTSGTDVLGLQPDGVQWKEPEYLDDG